MQSGEAATRSGVLRSTSLGLALGFDALGHCLAIATLVFAGPLAHGLGLGSALFLLSTLVCTLALMRWSGLPSALGVAQDATIAILAGVVASVAAGVVAPEARLATALAVIGLSTLASGLVLYLMGRFGLGRLARVVPYPVALGFLASSGWLLTFAALSVMVGSSGHTEVFAALISRETLPISAPAVLLALSLVVTLRLWSGAAGMMLVLTLSFLSFHAVLAGLGISLAEARAMGLVPEVPASGGGFGMDWRALGLIDWPVVARAMPGLAVIVVVNVIAVFLNTTGAELATRSDLDMNRELRLSGRTNMVLGLVGGLTSFVSTGSTVVAHRFGGGHRLLSYSYAAVILGGCLVAAEIVAVVPVFLTAGLLLFFGLSMLEDWLIRPLRRLVFQDRLIVLAVIGVTVFSGVFAAIAAGLAFALAAFVISYARVPMMRRKGTHQPRRSIVERDPAQEAILREGWSRVRLAQLQGYLFFGSIERLLSEVRAPGGSAGQAGGWLVLDFASVTGLDSSSCAALEKLSYLAGANGVKVQLCAMAPELVRILTRWNPDFAQAFGFGTHDSLEEALEAVEEALLGDHPLVQAGGNGLERLLTAAAVPHPRLGDLRALFQPRDLQDGEVLIQAGSRQQDIYVVQDGRLAVFLDGGMGRRVRVRVFVAGSVVGEVARYLSLPRTADVVSEGASRVQCLPAATLDRLEGEDAELAVLIHAILARGLAEKVVRTNLLVAD